ncbi:MAG: CocE/NonD family hydrolase [Catenulispora sp.]|nr:CocE/NonD family hydrolase [Catenulispora sp.]
MKVPRSTKFFRRTLRRLPAPKYGVGYEPGIRIPMPDGVELLGDHYFPQGAEAREFPTLLVRSPYGRGFPWAAVYGLAFAEQGFHVLIQSWRGTGGSGGTVQPWRDVGPDGQATVAWLRGQPWFDGRLGLLGPSAMAYAAWALAADPPPELKAMVVHVPLHDPHSFFFRSGAFALEDALIAATAFETQHLGPRRFIHTMWRLARGLKRIVDAEQPVEQYAREMGWQSPVLAGAAAHPDGSDGYWQGTDLIGAASLLEVPTLVVSGWSDVALDQALQQYGGLARAEPRRGSRSLLVGPWTHTSAFQQGIGTVFGESLAWLRGHLVDPMPPKGRALLAMGPDAEWREEAAWPPAAVPVTWYAQSDGTLGQEVPDSAATIGAFEHDPADPAPSIGGSYLGGSAGRREDTKLERRADVVTFSSSPLTDVVEVIGSVATDLTVHVSGTEEATIFARLCDVDKRGRSWNVCDGITQISAGLDRTVSVAMSATAYRFLPGHRIRLQLSAGAHPRFAASRQAYRVELQAGSALVIPVV